MTPDLAPVTTCHSCGSEGLEVLNHAPGSPGVLPALEMQRAAAAASPLHDQLIAAAEATNGDGLADRLRRLALRRAAARLACLCTARYPVAVAIDDAADHARALLAGGEHRPIDWFGRAFPGPPARSTRAG